MSGVKITPVRTEADLCAVAALFRAYEASLGVDLGYQDFESELRSLPGEYAPPAGELLIARDASGAAVGCVALRPMDDQQACEMKRLYISPELRGRGLGKLLLFRAIGEAKRVGYHEIWLDTLPTMTTAQALYRAAGFKPAAAYYDAAIAGTVFMRLSLRDT